MARNESAQATQAPMPPGPDPALKRLDRFVGTWNMKGRTLGSDEDNVAGKVSFEWLPGGFFLQQRVELNFSGYDIKGLEVIGYDPSTDTFPSTVYSSMIGVPIPYTWKVDGNEITIRTELGGGATYHGTWAKDGKSMKGGWRPDEGADPTNIAYDIWGEAA